MIRLARFLKPFAISVAAILVLVLFQSLGDLYLPTLMADIVDTGIVKGNTAYIWRIGGFMLLVAGGGHWIWQRPAQQSLLPGGELFTARDRHDHAHHAHDQ